MDRTTGLSKRQTAMLAALLGLAVFAPLLLGSNSRFPWLPVWLGAVIGFVGLIGALLVFQQTGVLRTRFLVLFVVGVGVAVACGALLAHN